MTADEDPLDNGEAQSPTFLPQALSILPERG